MEQPKSNAVRNGLIAFLVACVIALVAVAIWLATKKTDTPSDTTTSTGSGTGTVTATGGATGSSPPVVSTPPAPPAVRYVSALPTVVTPVLVHYDAKDVSALLGSDGSAIGDALTHNGATVGQWLPSEYKANTNRDIWIQRAPSPMPIVVRNVGSSPGVYMPLGTMMGTGQTPPRGLLGCAVFVVVTMHTQSVNGPVRTVIGMRDEQSKARHIALQTMCRSRCHCTPSRSQ